MIKQTKERNIAEMVVNHERNMYVEMIYQVMHLLLKISIYVLTILALLQYCLVIPDMIQSSGLDSIHVLNKQGFYDSMFKLILLYTIYKLTKDFYKEREILIGMNKLYHFSNPYIREKFNIKEYDTMYNVLNTSTIMKSLAYKELCTTINSEDVQYTNMVEIFTELLDAKEVNSLNVNDYENIYVKYQNYATKFNVIRLYNNYKKYFKEQKDMELLEQRRQDIINKLSKDIKYNKERNEILNKLF